MKFRSKNLFKKNKSQELDILYNILGTNQTFSSKRKANLFVEENGIHRNRVYLIVPQKLTQKMFG